MCDISLALEVFGKVLVCYPETYIGNERELEGGCTVYSGYEMITV